MHLYAVLRSSAMYFEIKPYENIGGRIKQYLDDNGRKYKFVYESIGLRRTLFSKIIHGYRKLTAEEFMMICDLLELDPRFLATYPIKNNHSHGLDLVVDKQ